MSRWWDDGCMLSTWQVLRGGAWQVHQGGGTGSTVSSFGATVQKLAAGDVQCWRQPLACAPDVEGSHGRVLQLPRLLSPVARKARARAGQRCALRHCLDSLRGPLGPILT